MTSTVRWTAPKAGNYDISGLFSATNYSSFTNANAGVYKGGTQIWKQAMVINGVYNFNFLNTSLGAGESIYFITWGSTTKNTWARVPFDATITESSKVVPEPATMLGLLAFAPAGLALLRRKK